MNMNSLKAAARLLCLGLMLISCEEQTESYYVGMGTVETADNRCAIAFDNDRTLSVADDALLRLYDADKPGQRVITTFQYADESREGSPILLHSLYKVLTKPFFHTPTEQESDSLGHDPLRLTAAWTAGNHLNVRFKLLTAPYAGKPHLINMVLPEETPDSEGYLQLELRHNDQGNPAAAIATGYASFPTDALPEGLKGFRITYDKEHGEKGQLTVTLGAETKPAPEAPRHGEKPSAIE